VTTDTVAEAASAFLVDIDANITGSVADYLAKASQRLRAALAAHDQQGEPIFRGTVDALEDWAGDFEVSGEDDRRVVVYDDSPVPLDGEENGTPEPAELRDQIRKAVNGATPYHADAITDAVMKMIIPSHAEAFLTGMEEGPRVPAAPEGGELEEDLLAPILAGLLDAHDHAGCESCRDVAIRAHRQLLDLASAIQSERGRVGLIRRQVERRDYRIAELERELAEARTTPFDVTGICAWLKEHRGWDSADVEELEEALRAAGVVVLRATAEGDSNG
jgi:hypothetical protein